MSKLKSILLMGLSMVLVAALSISGTLAYLQDTDSAVNVMTLGKVGIVQYEYERAVDADGKWISTGETDKYGYTPDELQTFTQFKPLYPAVFADGVIKWDDRNGSENPSGTGSHQQSWGQVGAPGSNQLFDDSVKNVVDHFVFVQNIEGVGVYVRTWFAFEQGAIEADNFKNVIMTNANKDHWSWETVGTDVKIAGNTYVVLCATYLGPKSNPTGILAPGAFTYPSLLQIYMKPEATNENCADIDGNNNGLYDVLVFSQAVQCVGFNDATTALTAAYGTAHPWIAADGKITDADTLQNNINVPNTNIKLDSNITSDEALSIPENATIDIDLGKNTLDSIIENDGIIDISNGTVDGDYVENRGEATFTDVTMNTGTSADYASINLAGSVTEYNNVDINADGGAVAVVGGEAIFNSGSVTVSTKITNPRYNFYLEGAGSKLTINGGTFSFAATTLRRAYIYAGEGTTVIINGGNFGAAANKSGYTAGILGTGTVIIKGGTFGFNPSAWVADGYEAVQNGTTWTVVAK